MNLTVDLERGRVRAPATTLGLKVFCCQNGLGAYIISFVFEADQAYDTKRRRKFASVTLS